MRKQYVTIIILLMTVILVGCSSSNNSDTNGASNVDSSNSTKEESKKTFTGPLIDANNALDERESIILLVEEQKEFLNFGFTNEDTPFNDITIHRIMNDEGEYELLYESFYFAPNTTLSASISNDQSICEGDWEERSEELKDLKTFHYDSVEGYYGTLEVDVFATVHIVAKHNEKCFSSHVITDESLSDEDKERVVELITQSLKIEDEGAYDPLYPRFTLDFSKIKFPTVNEERASIWASYIAYHENMYDSPHSEVIINYDLGDYHIEFEVTDAPQIFLIEETEQKFETKSGTKVSKFESDGVGQPFQYIWTDGGYTYKIGHWEDSGLTEDEVLEIVDSAMADNRSFDSLDFFQGVNDQADLGENELEILEKYYY